MSYGNPYNYPPGYGRGKATENVPNRAYAPGNENHAPDDLYGRGVSQNPPPEAFYHHPDMSRRPLQTVQVENSQPMQYYGYSQPPACGFDRPVGYGRGYADPRGYAASEGMYRQPGPQGPVDVDMRFAAAGPATRHFQEPSMPGRPMYPMAADALVAAGPGYPGPNLGYCETPPNLYSGFTPSHTSTPITTDGAATVTDTICTSTSVGRGYAQPSSKAPAQQPGAAKTSGAAVAIWARPAPKAPVSSTPQHQPRGAASDTSRGVAVTSRASSLTDSGAAAAAFSSRSASPMPSATSSRGASPMPSATSSRGASPMPSAATQPRQQQAKAAPNLERGTRIITGFVENILAWGRKLEEEARPNLLFEIVGSLDSVVNGHWCSSKLVCLRSLEGNKSATISAIYFEIDMPLAAPPLGSIVVCVCRLAPKWSKSVVELQQVPQRRMPRMHVLKMKTISPDQVAHFRRTVYVSSHAVAQGTLTAAGNHFGAAEPQQQQQAAPAAAPLKQTLISSHLSARTPRQ